MCIFRPDYQVIRNRGKLSQVDNNISLGLAALLVICSGSSVLRKILVPRNIRAIQIQKVSFFVVLQYLNELC